MFNYPTALSRQVIRMTQIYLYWDRFFHTHQLDLKRFKDIWNSCRIRNSAFDKRVAIKGLQCLSPLTFTVTVSNEKKNNFICLLQAQF